MAQRCRSCRDGLEHCHGTLIHHPLRRAECTEDSCPGAQLVAHAFAVDCEAVGCGCAGAQALAV